MVFVVNEILSVLKKYSPATGIISKVIIFIILSMISTMLADLTPLKLMIVTMANKQSSCAAKIYGDFIRIIGVR